MVPAGPGMPGRLKVFRIYLQWSYLILTLEIVEGGKRSDVGTLHEAQ